VAALKQTGSFMTSPASEVGNKQNATVVGYKGRCTLSVKLSEFSVTSYLTDKLSKLLSFDRL